MFTAIKDNKIIAYNNTGVFPCLVYDEVRKVADVELIEVNGEFVAKDDVKAIRKMKDAQIAELKQKLADTDYKAIKYAEGEYTDEDYTPVKEMRKEWRRAINELEEQL